MPGKKKNKNDKPYKVGYGKPPKEYQFKPGQSGNPKGPPKGLKIEVESEKDIRALYWKAATTPVATTVGGKREKIPALQAAYYKLLSRAIEGHVPSIRMVHTLSREFMAEHEELRATFYEYAMELVKELKSQPEGEKSEETLILLRQLIERIDEKIADKF